MNSENVEEDLTRIDLLNNQESNTRNHAAALDDGRLWFEKPEARL